MKRIVEYLACNLGPINVHEHHVQSLKVVNSDTGFKHDCIGVLFIINERKIGSRAIILNILCLFRGLVGSKNQIGIERYIQSIASPALLHLPITSPLPFSKHVSPLDIGAGRSRGIAIGDTAGPVAMGLL